MKKIVGFVVGDEVTLIDNLFESDNSVEDMCIYNGKRARIESIRSDSSFCSLDIDDGYWVWSMDMFKKKIYKGDDIMKKNKEVEKIYTKEMLRGMNIKAIYFLEETNTITVKLSNGEVGTSKCSSDDFMDVAVGFGYAYALAKSNVGSKKQFKENVSYIGKFLQKNGKFIVED